ncbi:hypothetical protein BaRGS_00017782 [Batillaria attramentaria]|uniref:Uncharacterized protein n=1 Tax=Batillaria attramentaria TaxID=370345 RepID=A0ABD0KUT1_9CAEN
MMPRLNYNTMDMTRSTDPTADDSPEDSGSHRYVHLESFELPSETKPPKQTTPLLNGKSLPGKIASLFCDCWGGNGYEDLPGGKKKSRFELRRNLTALGGVFAPVALGQLATNIFLRTGECPEETSERIRDSLTFV